MNDIIIKIENLKKEYGNSIILDIENLTVKRGELLSVIGPNGAGKSTLLRITGLLETFNSGEFYLSGEKVISGKDNLKVRRKISSVFQKPFMYNMTVRENVALGLKFRKLPAGEIENKVNLWLEKLGIKHLSSRKATELSGGEAGRVSLARAFVTDPELILLDEPFSELDPPAAEALIYELKSLLSSTGITAIFVTHSRDEALILSHRVAVMINGKIAQQGRPSDVFNYPVNEKIAAFVGIETILDGEVIENSDNLAEIKIQGDKILKASSDLKPGKKVKIFIRPENVILSTGKRGEDFKSSFRNNFSGKIIKLIPCGLYYKAILDCGFNLISFITKQTIEEMELKEDKIINACFKATSVHIIKLNISVIE